MEEKLRFLLSVGDAITQVCVNLKGKDDFWFRTE